MPSIVRFLAARRHARAVVGAACMTGALAFAQPAPPISAPLPVPVMPPVSTWRAPMLQVQGAEQPVRLASLQVDVEVAGGAAETRVQMVFFNPNNRILEGKLQFPLAPGQVVSGFALDVDGRLRAAVPVEKARAQQVFEDIARRRVDPGLLQTTIGNNYELRVYPLLPGKTRTVELRIVEPARGPAPGAARLRRARRCAGAVAARSRRRCRARAGRRRARSACASSARRTAASSPARPATTRRCRRSRSRCACRRSAEAPAIATEERDGQSYFTLELPVAQRSAPRPLPHRVQIVWDASGSGAHRQLDRELALLDAYFSAVRDTSVSLVRVADVAAAPIRFEVRGGDWAALRKRARDDGLRRRQQPRRGAPRRRLGRSALVQRRPGQLRRAVAARLPGAGVRDQQRHERRPGGAAGARRRERRPQHRPRERRRARARPTRCCGAARDVAGVSALGARELVVQSQSAAAGPARRRRRADRGRSRGHGATARRHRRGDDARRAGARRPQSVAPGGRAVGTPDARIARGRSAHEQGPHPRDRQALRPGDARDLADRPRARRRLRAPRDRAAGRAARCV